MGQAVQERHPRHSRWVIEYEPQGNGGTSVVTDKPEALMSERTHDPDHVLSYGSFGVRSMIGRTTCRRAGRCGRYCPCVWP